MFTKQSLLFVAILALLKISASNGQDSWTFSTKLHSGGKYDLVTNVNLTSSRIEFQATVQTEGWLGLGFSSRPDMFSADMFMGWLLPNGAVNTNNDYYGNATRNTRPVPDAENNWSVTSGSRTGNTLKLTFSRNLKVTNPTEDREIKDEMINLIWAYGTMNDTNGLPNYHEAEVDKRGSVGINLLRSSSTTNSISVSMIMSILALWVIKC